METQELENKTIKKFLKWQEAYEKDIFYGSNF